MSKATFNAGLKASTEALTNAEQTIIYTAKGQPSFMYVLKKFDMSTIDPNLSGTHPAFIVNGVEKSEIYIGVYQATLVNGELVSQPNIAPSRITSPADFLTAVRANGAGHHLITNAEWAALALQSAKNNTQPQGNTYFGRSADDATQFGRRIDGVSASAGITTGTPVIFTGSGPVSFRHNGRYNGISDMAGNIAEYCSGLRLVNGEVQILANNNAALSSADFSATSSEWKAISGVDGTLITPDGSGTTANSVKMATSGTNAYTLVFVNYGLFSAITNPSSTPVSTLAMNLLKALAIVPISNFTYNNDMISALFSGERITYRGGRWDAGIGGGIFKLQLDVDRSVASGDLGTRTAYYAP